MLRKWLKDFRSSGKSPSDGSNNNSESRTVHKLLVNDRLVPVEATRKLLPRDVGQNRSDPTDGTVTCPVHRRSRLKPALKDVFLDEGILTTFIQYLDVGNAGHLIRFCLETDTFASSYSHSRRCDISEIDENGEAESEVPKLNSRQRDALIIYRKYFAPESSSIIPVPEEIRNAAIKNICSDCGEIPVDCFRPSREKVVQILEEKYFSNFLQSEQFCRFQIDFLTNRRGCLADFIYADTAMFYFREFMENEGVVDLLMFVVAVDTYHSLLHDETCTPEQALEYAMDIYDRYFSLQALTPLGFDDSIRLEMECRICCENGPSKDTFEKPRQIVLQYIEKSFLPAYLNSQLFYKYLGDLVYTAQTSDLACIPRMRPRRVTSDSESLSGWGAASSISQQDAISIHSEPVTNRNTLLAGATAHGRSLRRALDRVGGDLRINPDPLVRPGGRRSSKTGDQSADGSSNSSMTFGHVDDFGQFHSEIEDLSMQENGLLSSVFKRSKDKKQAEEEMALVVARMIIKDVQAMTSNAQIQALTPGDR